MKVIVNETEYTYKLDKIDLYTYPHANLCCVFLISTSSQSFYRGFSIVGSQLLDLLSNFSINKIYQACLDDMGVDSIANIDLSEELFNE